MKAILPKILRGVICASTHSVTASTPAASNSYSFFNDSIPLISSSSQALIKGETFLCLAIS